MSTTFQDKPIAGDLSPRYSPLQKSRLGQVVAANGNGPAVSFSQLPQAAKGLIPTTNGNEMSPSSATPPPTTVVNEDTRPVNGSIMKPQQAPIPDEILESPKTRSNGNLQLDASERRSSVPAVNLNTVEKGLDAAKTNIAALRLPSEAALSAAANPIAQRNGSGKHSAIAKSVIGNPKAQLVSATKDSSMLAPPATVVPSLGITGTKGSMTPMKSGDTPPGPTAPSSPRLHATTLNIPGVTKSKVSLDGSIPDRDIGAKLLIVMVGLPARGKSYITKKLARYMNWQQYQVEIFNVGNRRRTAAKEPLPDTPPGHESDIVNGAVTLLNKLQEEKAAARSPIRGTGLFVAKGGQASPPKLTLSCEAGASPVSLKNDSNTDTDQTDTENEDEEEEEDVGMAQDAEFFDPNNRKASKIREKVAMETLQESLQFLLEGGGDIAILDATNSTQERRQAIVDKVNEHVKEQRPQILFIESVCEDQKILEANMRLKLSGPDYKDQDPEQALADFKKRVQMYEGAYTPIGEYEEKQDWQYIKLIDVGRKFVAHGTRGFLATNTAYYLMNFNLAPRQIWITRHGESQDNVLEKIGGDAELTAKGVKYAENLAKFIDKERAKFHVHLLDQHAQAEGGHRGDITPPNPETSSHFIGNEDGDYVPEERHFCVWTSTLKRSIQTAQLFDEDKYDIKQWRILDELNAGRADGLTYNEIKAKYPEDWEERRKHKLTFRYPGLGGESYMDVIHRLKDIIVEVERMQDHVILVGHRVVARVLLAYFMGLPRTSVANLHIPIGHLFVLEPKPYGVEFRAYEYDTQTGDFEHMPGYKLDKTEAEKREFEEQERQMCVKRKAERQKSAPLFEDH